MTKASLEVRRFGSTPRAFPGMTANVYVVVEDGYAALVNAWRAWTSTPLVVDGDRVQALDAVLTWQGGASPH